MTPQKLLDNFSTHLKNTIARAISLAHELEMPSVEPLHLFIALTEEPDSVAAEILKKADVPVEEMRRNLQARRANWTASEEKPTLPDLSPQTSAVIEKALLIAFERGHSYIGTEHLLYSILQIEDKAIHQVLTTVKVDPGHLFELTENTLEASGNPAQVENMTETIGLLASTKDQINSQTMSKRKSTQKKNDRMSATDFFTVNLTDPLIEKKLDPVIGRETEISRVINILSRRTKNNPILIGEPGVGKTAIVEGLAKKIRQGEIPEVLKRKKILSLDLTLMIAGTIYRGEFEARLKQVIDELSGNQNSILFIDELHTIIGAGSNQGTLDAANILKPALARGALRCIGATTFDEYKKYIASDPALERRFQPIFVNEPTSEQTIEIVSGIRKYYEDFHNLKINDDAITTAVNLSTKYVHDSYQPDKTIDIIDETAAAVKVRRLPSALEVKQSALVQALETYESQKSEAITKEQLIEAARFKQLAAKAKRDLTKLEAQAKKTTSKRQTEVTAQDVIKTVSERLNIPEKLLGSNDWERLENAQLSLGETLVGQSQAVEDIIRTLRERYLGLGRKGKPLASFLFVGPSGVGKTELAKQLAESLYHDPKALIKLDMSEYAESHSVAKILGSPAGYIGYKDRNPLFDNLRRHPYSIILLDEIDKAHPDVRKLLLQILDEGELADSSGKKVHFNHAIIILTANIGSDLFKSAGIGFGEAAAGDNHQTNPAFTKKIMNAVKEELTPAIISRLDKVCIFPPLSNEHVQKIITQEIARMSSELLTAQRLTVKPDDQALIALVKEAYHPELGARPIHHLLERVIPELVIKIITNKKTKRKQQYTLSHEHEGYILK